MAKENIHPKYYPKASVRCSCGNTFEIGSTKQKIEVEVCSNCHSFYTGEEKMIDTMGQIQKFKERMEKQKKIGKKKK